MYIMLLKILYYYRKYKHYSKQFIDIDLQGQTVKQTDT